MFKHVGYKKIPLQRQASKYLAAQIHTFVQIGFQIDACPIPTLVQIGLQMTGCPIHTFVRLVNTYIYTDRLPDNLLLNTHAFVQTGFQIVGCQVHTFVQTRFQMIAFFILTLVQIGFQITGCQIHTFVQTRFQMIAFPIHLPIDRLPDEWLPNTHMSTGSVQAPQHSGKEQKGNVPTDKLPDNWLFKSGSHTLPRLYR